ncbi:hypothetical protein F2P81_003591 [Scophthalmus maximus]|uniref:Uncharacterized protein n=1 Tax=Scophthalmus maximus TaxID=52904 RepID=A0A6A4TEM1_SCOMX|nr:hypothetical protein F2P81_003591 [Scophthalmus maximus]
MRATTVVAQVSSATPQQLARSVNFNVFQNKTPGSLTRHVNEEKENSGVGHDKILNGSVYTVRFGSRSLPLYPLVIVCLGLLNTILLSTAVAIGIYCSTVDEESSPHQISAPALILEQKELKILRSEVIKALKEYEQALEKELRSHEQLNLQMEQNKTLSDSLQTRLETLHVEKAILLSETSEISERRLH